MSADADGWVVVWDVVTKRAVAVWKAHGEGVLGVEVFFDGKGGWLVRLVVFLFLVVVGWVWGGVVKWWMCVV